MQRALLGAQEKERAFLGLLLNLDLQSQAFRAPQIRRAIYTSHKLLAYAFTWKSLNILTHKSQESYKLPLQSPYPLHQRSSAGLGAVSLLFFLYWCLPSRTTSNIFKSNFRLGTGNSHEVHLWFSIGQACHIQSPYC